MPKSKRSRQDEQRCHDTDPVKRLRSRHKHLYLVLDDWEMGYSIHRLGIEEFYSEAGTNVGRLPTPSILRLQAPVDRTSATVVAADRKIFIMTDQSCEETPILIYDTETAALAVGPRPPTSLLPGGFSFIVPIGRRLYALNPRRADGQHRSFEVMSPALRDEEDDFMLSRRYELWSWKSVSSPLPFERDEFITAYAVHPDGRTIFVSARNRATLADLRKMGTFSFDTERSVWTWHGEWMLPFKGQGHYVSELDAWVGLNSDGFLCSCDVASRSERTSSLDSKIGEESMFREEPERHIGDSGATLTHMGDSVFCLVECAARQGVEIEDALSGGKDCCVLHVSIFGLRYNNVGGIQTTAHHHARTYLVSRYNGPFSAKAFWM